MELASRLTLGLAWTFFVLAAASDWLAYHPPALTCHLHSTAQAQRSAVQVTASRCVALRRRWAGGARERKLKRVALIGGPLLLTLALCLRALACKHWPLSSWADRAIILALLGSSIGIIHSRKTKISCSGMALLPVAIPIALAALGPASKTDAQAPTLVLLALASASLLLWAFGQRLVAALGLASPNDLAFRLGFAGLGLTLVASSLVNWRIWGTATGDSSATVALAAVWLLAAARFTLSQEPGRWPTSLEFASSLTAVLTSLFIQWN